MSHGDPANENRNFASLLVPVGNFVSSLFRKPRILGAAADNRTQHFLRSRSETDAPGVQLGFTQTGSWFLLTSCKPVIVMPMTLAEDAYRRNGRRKFS